MEVKVWTPENPPSEADWRAWDAYAAAHKGGTIFHSARWLEIINRAYRRPYHHMAVLEGGALKGLLSIYRVRSLSGKKSLYSLPFTAYGGMLTDGPEAARLLHDRALEIARAENAGMVHLRNTVDPGLGLPSTDLHVHFAKALPQTEQECLESIPRKSRATVRKSMSNHGLTYEINGDWRTLWELHAVNLKRLGTPVFPKEFFRHIMDVMGDDADILFVKYQGKPVCGVMTFYFKGVCNPYFSGALGEYNFTGCNNYMYYALMCHGLKRNCTSFDFGKSRRGSGSYDFKCNMGFEPKTLPFQFIFNTRSDLPSFNPSNPKLALFLKVWGSQPLWTSKLAGSFLNRFLP
jgi:FemAB-related protein (PEP-CTERM system-associated)